MRVSIAPQPLEGALVALATQANISLSLPNGGGFEDRQSPGLHGSYSVEGALNALLRGSGYRYERVGADAYRVVPALHGAIPPSRAESDEIIVTAARESTELRRLPRSLSHIDAAQLNHAGIDDDEQLGRLLGGVAFTNLGEGRDKILLRGISDGALTGNAQSLVSLYFGDSRITYAAPDPDLLLVDIASVDVLRGPQGALYGAGAMGGVLRIEPNPVDLSDSAGSLHAQTEFTRAGGAGESVDLMYNAPIVPNQFGIRGVFYDEQDAGWVDNPRLNESNTNHTQRRGARLQAMTQLGAQWSLAGAAILQTIDTKDAQYQERTPAGLERTANLLEPHDNDFSLYGLTLRGDTGWSNLTSSTSYVTHALSSRFDVTGQFASLGLDPSRARPLDEDNTLQIVVHETRLSSPANAMLPWFVGLFYSEGDFTHGLVVRDGPYGAWPDIAYHEHRVDSVDEGALFGELTWPITDRISLATGARLFQSDISTRSSKAEPLLGMTASASRHLVDSGVAPDIRLSYQPADTMLFFLSAAEGYRSGGFNTGGPIGAPLGPLQPQERYSGDHLWTFEAGGRISLAGGRVRLQAVAFLNDWRDIQTDSLRANGLTYSGNVGDARAFGFELNAHAMATDHLTVDADIQINEPELTSVRASFPEAAHGALPGSPEYSASTSLRYENMFVAGGATWTWFAQLDAQYVGDAKLGFGQGPRVGGYIQTDARIGLSTAHWSAMLYADNLTNSDGPTFSPGNPYQPGLTFETPLRPLTVGISLQRAF
ncbi:MAG: TonB-dependent receptor [Proteobacteria bacterium]|nr:TonB-dependent receptor [Pseudomonadota bacterium]